nr:head GIN domain-containing protein [uncultured Carboxylicivirga sp.]
MKPILLASALFLFANFITNAQEKEQRTVSDFSKIEVSSGVNLYITQGEDIELIVEGDKSEMHKIITEVSNNTLKIYNKRNYMWGVKQAPKVYLTFKQLEELIAGGGSDVYGQSVLNAIKIKISTSGGADAYLEVVADEITLNSSGGSDIKIKGTTPKLIATASGGSDIDAGALKAQVADVTTSGGADAKVWVEKELTAKASGGSDIDYYGNPSLKNINESGGGDITQR